ncbi:hypothetical protein [Microbacterium sp. KKR3/1]|nr:hypothetical protein [Microbacterium sp. KKR3/1]
MHSVTAGTGEPGTGCTTKPTVTTVEEEEEPWAGGAPAGRTRRR